MEYVLRLFLVLLFGASLIACYDADKVKRLKHIQNLCYKQDSLLQEHVYSLEKYAKLVDMDKSFMLECLINHYSEGN